MLADSWAPCSPAVPSGFHLARLLHLLVHAGAAHLHSLQLICLLHLVLCNDGKLFHTEAEHVHFEILLLDACSRSFAHVTSCMVPFFTFAVPGWFVLLKMTT